MTPPTIVTGDLLDQPTEAIVNAWNRNVIPWWLLLPQGVSGAIKRRAGLAPFRELGRLGPIPLGGAVATGAGRLPYRVILHVAAINLLWRASPRSIADATANALVLADDAGPPVHRFPDPRRRVGRVRPGGGRADHGRGDRADRDAGGRHPGPLPQEVTLDGQSCPGGFEDGGADGPGSRTSNSMKRGRFLYLRRIEATSSSHSPARSSAV